MTFDETKAESVSTNRVIAVIPQSGIARDRKTLRPIGVAADLILNDLTSNQKELQSRDREAKPS